MKPSFPAVGPWAFKPLGFPKELGIELSPSLPHNSP